MKDIKYYSDKLNIELSPMQLEQFETYMHMVIEKNKVMNLTAITDEDEFRLKHIADSLSLVAAADYCSSIMTGSPSVIDVGTGAGFPGIPLKIAFPDIRLTLLDSLNKRILFLDDVIRELGLTGVETIHARAEEGARRPGLRDSFDYAVSRAVAAQSQLLEYCLPYVKVGGYFIAYKSGDIDEELADAKNALNKLNGLHTDIIRFSLADSDIGRSFVITKKKAPTPKTYPRKPGTAKKEPL